MESNGSGTDPHYLSQDICPLYNRNNGNLKIDYFEMNDEQ